MKNNSDVSMWSLMGLISLLGMLGLLVSVSVFAETVDISIDPSNAVQYIDSVNIIQVGNASANALITSEGLGLLKVETNSNILLGNDNKIVSNGNNSTILGGTRNTITGGQASTIIAGAGNGINGSESNTILGGQLNQIKGLSSFSTIAGGLGNTIDGTLSTIVGGRDNQITGNYSVIVGEENSVMGNNSVAIGKKSTVNANNSFLWTDSTKNGQLDSDNVFAVVSRRGMVINASSPNQYAQLTIGGPLVVSMNDNDKNVACGLGQGGGTMKTIFTGGRYCLCSCDGSSRNSMFGQGQCQSICHGDSMQPVCGTEVDRVACGGFYTFRGTCEAGYVVNGTGAYLVDKNNVVHWTCQTSAGTSVACSSSTITQVSHCPGNCEGTPWGTVLDGHSVTAYLSDNPTGECNGIKRTCHDGNLDGDTRYNKSTCDGGCKIPWSDGYISNGENLTAYEQSLVPFGSSCVSHQRVCNNGSLDGIGDYSGCSVQGVRSCYHNGVQYNSGAEIVTYSRSSYQCLDGCNNHVVTGVCNDGYWVNALGEHIDLAYYTRCDSTDSLNAVTYTLSSCPSEGTCSTETVYLGGEYPNNSCSTSVKYKLESCNAGYYQSGDNCVLCPTGYTSNTGAKSQSNCVIRCNDAQHIAVAGASGCVSCPEGTYITGHNVNYGYKSTCFSCDNGPAYSVYTSNGTGNNCSWNCIEGYSRVGDECRGTGA